MTKSKKPKPKKRRLEFRTLAAKIEAARRILDEYSGGEFTLASICESHGIPYSTFHGWAVEGPGQVEEVGELLKRAKAEKSSRYLEKLSHRAITSLQKRLEGFKTEERQEEFLVSQSEAGEEVRTLTKVKTITREIPPDTGAIIFTLKHTDPGLFGDTPKGDAVDSEKLGYFEAMLEMGRQIIAGDSPEKPSKGADPGEYRNSAVGAQPFPGASRGRVGGRSLNTAQN